MALFAGCSPGKLSSGNKDTDLKRNAHQIVDQLIKNNINGTDYNVIKGSVSVRRSNKAVKYIFSLRHKAPDTYLLSIKNSLGIEGGRIFITHDTLLINDRISRKVLYGKPVMIEKLTGIPVFFKELIFGDVVLRSELKEEQIEIVNSKVFVNQMIDGFIGISQINANLDKITNARWSNGTGINEIQISYSNFEKEGKHFPRKIQIMSVKESSDLIIRVDRIDFGLIDSIKFIPGENYTYEEIK
jgi:hypothetical protein